MQAADRRRFRLPAANISVGFDTLIMAIGQSADAASLHLEGRKNGTVCADPGNLATRNGGSLPEGMPSRAPRPSSRRSPRGDWPAYPSTGFWGERRVIAEALSEETVTEPPETAPRGARRPEVRTIAISKSDVTFDSVERTYPGTTASAEAHPLSILRPPRLRRRDQRSDLQGLRLL